MMCSFPNWFAGPTAEKIPIYKFQIPVPEFREILRYAQNDDIISLAVVGVHTHNVSIAGLETDNGDEVKTTQ